VEGSVGDVIHQIAQLLLLPVPGGRLILLHGPAIRLAELTAGPFGHIADRVGLSAATLDFLRRPLGYLFLASAFLLPGIRAGRFGGADVRFSNRYRFSFALAPLLGRLPFVHHLRAGRLARPAGSSGRSGLDPFDHVVGRAARAVLRTGLCRSGTRFTGPVVLIGSISHIAKVATGAAG